MSNYGDFFRYLRLYCGLVIEARTHTHTHTVCVSEREGEGGRERERGDDERRL